MLGVALGPEQRLLRSEGAVGVDEQLGLVPDRGAGYLEALRIGIGVSADLDLDARDAGLDPAAKLLGEPIGCVVGEAAAAVDRDALVEPRQDVGEREVEEARLQVPERDVDRRGGHRADAGPAGIAELCLDRGRDRGRAHRVAAFDQPDQLRLDERGDGPVAVGVTEAALSSRVCGDDDRRRLVPGQGPVALRALHRDRERTDVGPVDPGPARAAGAPIQLCYPGCHRATGS